MKTTNKKVMVGFRVPKAFHERILAFVAAANEKSDYHKYTIGEVIVEAVKEYMDGRQYLEGGDNEHVKK